jgi:hypothetical protein
MMGVIIAFWFLRQMFFKKIETVVISMLNQAHAVVSPRRNGSNPAKTAGTASR